MIKVTVIVAVVYYLAKREVGAGVRAVKEAREDASAKLTDIFANFTGLSKREERILNDPEYRRRFLAEIYGR